MDLSSMAIPILNVLDLTDDTQICKSVNIKFLESDLCWRRLRCAQGGHIQQECNKRKTVCASGVKNKLR